MSTHYVAEVAAGTEDGSSYDNRMDIVDHNANTYSFTAGDVIYLCDTISSQIEIPASGSTGDGNRITYKGDLSGHAGVLTANSSSGALYGTEKDYLIVDGIEIKNGKIAIALLDYCDYITIKKCTIHDMAVAGSKGIFISATDSVKRNSNIIIGGASGDGNEIYNVGVDTGGGDINLAHIDNLLVSHNKCYAEEGEVNTGIDGMALSVCDDAIVEYNSLYNHLKSSDIPVAQYGEDGIDLKGSTNVIVRYNSIHHNRSIGINVNVSDAAGINCSNIYIYGNSIHDNASNIVINDLDNNVYIFNNLIYSSTSVHGISCSPTGDGIYIYNNVLVNNSGTGARFAILASTGNNYYIKNNIIYDDTHNDLVYVSGATNVNIDNNQYYYTGGAARVYWDGDYRTLAVLQSTYSQELNGQEGDPKLTNVASNIFTLLSDSPCINQGANLGVDYDDALNPDSTDFTTFPPTVNTLDQDDYGTGWEMGAYVYTSAEPYDRFRGIGRIKMPFNMNVGRRFI